MRNTGMLRHLALVSALGAALVAAGGASPAPTRSTASAAKPATAKQWAQIVAKAKREGAVTLYTSQNPTLLGEMAAKFKEKYGITVTVSRNLDAVNVQQVTAEHSTGNVKADVWVSSSRPHALGAHQAHNRWVAPAVGPALFRKSFDRKRYAKPGDAVIVGAALIACGELVKRLFP